MPASKVIQDSQVIDLTEDELSTSFHPEMAGTAVFQFVSTESNKAIFLRLPFATLRMMHAKLEPFCR